MTIYLPLPPKSMSGNSRAHYMVKAKDARGTKTLAIVSCQKQGGDLAHYQTLGKDPTTLFVIHVNAYPAKPGCLPKGLCCPDDQDNGVIACKGYRDGIAEAIGIDDKRMSTRWNRLSHADRKNRQAKLKDIGDNGGLIVTIYPTLKGWADHEQS